MNVNNSIKCDVTNCSHNCKGQNCQLQSISICCDGQQGHTKDCTCCSSFEEK